MVQLTDKDYNIISQKAYNLDPKEYKAEEQYGVGKEFDVNGRNTESLMTLHKERNIYENT